MTQYYADENIQDIHEITKRLNKVETRLLTNPEGRLNETEHEEIENVAYAGERLNLTAGYALNLNQINQQSLTKVERLHAINEMYARETPFHKPLTFDELYGHL